MSEEDKFKQILRIALQLSGHKPDSVVDVFPKPFSSSPYYGEIRVQAVIGEDVVWGVSTVQLYNRSAFSAAGLSIIEVDSNGNQTYHSANYVETRFTQFEAMHTGVLNLACIALAVQMVVWVDPEPAPERDAMLQALLVYLAGSGADLTTLPDAKMYYHDASGDEGIKAGVGVVITELDGGTIRIESRSQYAFGVCCTYLTQATHPAPPSEGGFFTEMDMVDVNGGLEICIRRAANAVGERLVGLSSEE